MGMPPLFHTTERWAGVALSLCLAIVLGYFVVGLNLYPVDEIVNPQPGVTFDVVRPSVGWPLQAALAIACLGAATATVLTAIGSRWAFLAILLHFIASKTAWVLSAFVPYYEGGAIGAWLTVIQIIAIVVIFRSTDPVWFRQQH